jgi:hypothetical protein
MRLGVVILPAERWAIAVALALSLPAAAQTPMPIPKLSVAEGIQQLDAAGFKIGDGTALNLCNTPAKPQITYLDLNNDGRPEALAVDRNPACYGEPGDWFTLVMKDAKGRWRPILRNVGGVSWEKTSTRGWVDARLSGGGHCDRLARFDGSDYIQSSDCVPSAGASGAANDLTVANRAAIYQAAGLTKKGPDWVGCEGHTTASIEKDDVRDINGDGQPDAIITESGSYCYGNTGQGFHLLTKTPGGAWKLLYSNTGIPTFLETRANGWPDVEIGGPGFCFPILRWTGNTYDFHRNHEYEKGACAQRD